MYCLCYMHSIIVIASIVIVGLRLGVRGGARLVRDKHLYISYPPIDNYSI